MARDDTTLHVNHPPTLAPAPRIPVGNPESMQGGVLRFGHARFPLVPSAASALHATGGKLFPPGLYGAEEGAREGPSCPGHDEQGPGADSAAPTMPYPAFAPWLGSRKDPPRRRGLGGRWVHR